LSESAIKLLAVGGPDAYRDLVVRQGGSADVRPMLSALSPANVLAGPTGRRDVADAVLAGLWLWHDWLDESHTLSQSITSTTGSFWHAIMHRREGDFSNAKYWYARCGGHPAHARFLASAEPLLHSAGGTEAGRRLRSGRDGYGLVDLAEQASQTPTDDPLHKLAVELQRLEWAALFDETLRSA